MQSARWPRAYGLEPKEGNVALAHDGRDSYGQSMRRWLWDLLGRWRDARLHSQDLAALRARFRASSRGARASAGEAREALRLRRLRREILATLGEVQACRSCARGHPLPHGRWEGGHCCGAVTLDIFCDDEVAALQLGGARPRDLRAPRGGRANSGCAFRGPRGCSLSAACRPNLCVRFLCQELRAELRSRGDFGRLVKLITELRRTFGRFQALRAARLEARADEEMEAAVRASLEPVP